VRNDDKEKRKTGKNINIVIIVKNPFSNSLCVILEISVSDLIVYFFQQ